MPKTLKPIPGRIVSDWKVLCEDIGERLAGTNGERRAADFVADGLADAGCDAVYVETFPCRSRRGSSVAVQVRDGRRWRDVECEIVTGSSSTVGGRVVEGELFWLEMPEQADLLRKDALRDKILVMFGPMPESVRDHKRLVAAHPLAVIHVDHRLPFEWAKNDGTYPLWVKKHGLPPTVTVPFMEAWHWRTQGLHRARVKASMKMVAARSTNVAGEMVGEDPSRGIVLFGAHHDSQANNVGADDNASGVVAILELARLLAPLRHQRTLRFVSFGTEEQLSVGSKEYVEAHRPELDDISLVINFDSISSPLGHCDLFYAGRKSVGQFGQKELARRGVHVELHDDVCPFSDHFPFTAHGVPAMWFYRQNFPGGRWQHHSVHDSLENVSVDAVCSLLAAAGGMALDIANMEALPFRRGLDAKCRERTDYYARLLYGMKP